MLIMLGARPFMPFSYDPIARSMSPSPPYAPPINGRVQPDARRRVLEGPEETTSLVGFFNHTKRPDAGPNLLHVVRASKEIQ